MNVPTTYASVVKRYPDQVQEIITKKCASKSKNIWPMTAEEMRWEFAWAVQINGTRRKHLVSLVGRAGRGVYSAKISGVPKEIQDIIDKQADDERKERDRVRKLTPAQRDAEVADAIRDLTKMGGFVEIKAVVVGPHPTRGHAGPA